MKKVVKKMVRALALLCSVALLLEAGPVISLAEAAMEEAALAVSAGENEIFETEGGSRLSYLIGEAVSLECTFPVLECMCRSACHIMRRARCRLNLIRRNTFFYSL